MEPGNTYNIKIQCISTDWVCEEMRMDIYFLVVWTGRREYEELDSVYLNLELCRDDYIDFNMGLLSIYYNDKIHTIN